jgi:hypothetical protein
MAGSVDIAVGANKFLIRDGRATANGKGFGSI